MTIQASCGHVLSENDGPDGMGHQLSVRTWSSDGTRAVSYRSACSLCRQQMLEAGVVLLTENEVDAWLAGRGDDDQPTW